MNKLYARINWENFPSENTALNESNLNRMDLGLDNLDNRVIEMDSTKVNKEVANSLVQSWSMDESTGIITITHLDGSKDMFDLNIEKIPVDFKLSEDGILTMTTDDGSKFKANIGAMIPVLTFEDSDTIAVSVSGEGVNKTYSFSIKAGSVTEDKLQPNFLADVRTEVAKAQASQESAAESASAASGSDTLAESYAHGGTGAREGEDADNARYYMEQAKAVSAVNVATTETAGIVKPDGETITVDEDGTLHGNASVTVDSELSDTSENPVQNKVVKGAVDELKQELAKKADTDHIHTTVNGHTVESDVPVDAKFTDTVYDDSSLSSKVTQNTNDISELKTTDNVLSSRIDAFASLTQGSTTGDAELIDIRVKADGTTATSAGNAVREQIGELKGDIVDLKNNIIYLAKDVNVTDRQEFHDTGIKLLLDRPMFVSVTPTNSNFFNVAIFHNGSVVRYLGVQLINGGSAYTWEITREVLEDEVYVFDDLWEIKIKNNSDASSYNYSIFYKLDDIADNEDGYLVVGKNGKCCFRNISYAVEYAKYAYDVSNDSVTVFVRNGTYNEKIKPISQTDGIHNNVAIYKGSNKLNIIGESRDNVIINIINTASLNGIVSDGTLREVQTAL